MEKRFDQVIILASTKKEAIERAKSDHPGYNYVKPYRYASRGNNFYLFQ